MGNKKTNRLNPYCKKCAKEKSRKWVKNNPERYAKALQKSNARPERKKVVKEYNKRRVENGEQAKWQQNNKDKLEKYRMTRSNKNHTITNIEWEMCKQYFCHRCAYCGLPIEEHFWTRKGVSKLGDFHKEHVIHNGNNDLSNCVPSCKSCNCKKIDFDFYDWYSIDNPIYNQERYETIIKWLEEDYKLYIKQ